MYRIILLICLLFCSCHEQARTNERTVIITGREPERIPLYRIKVPENWTVEFPSPEISLIDSRLSLLECSTLEGIKITIHNFPADDPAMRIPPQAQLQRWKQQFTPIDPTSVLVTPQSFSGYKGFLLEAEGNIKGEPAAVMGWALQIGSDHYRNLSYTDLPNQMRADITIKAKGSPEAVALHKSAIRRFARSFELIEEVPTPR